MKKALCPVVAIVALFLAVFAARCCEAEDVYVGTAGHVYLYQELPDGTIESEHGMDNFVVLGNNLRIEGDKAYLSEEVLKGRNLKAGGKYLVFLDTLLRVEYPVYRAKGKEVSVFSRNIVSKRDIRQEKPLANTPGLLSGAKEKGADGEILVFAQGTYLAKDDPANYDSRERFVKTEDLVWVNQWTKKRPQEEWDLINLKGTTALKLYVPRKGLTALPVYSYDKDKFGLCGGREENSILVTEKLVLSGLSDLTNGGFRLVLPTLYRFGSDPTDVETRDRTICRQDLVCLNPVN